MNVFMERTGTWLCPTERDRERMVDMSARVKKARTISAIALGGALIASTPWVGVLPLVMLALVGGNLAIIEKRLANARRPEYVAAASMFFLQGVIVGGVGLTGGPTSPMMAWIVVPTAVVAARFRRHVVIAFAASAVILAVGPVIALHPGRFIDNPVPVFATLGLLVSLVAITSALMNAELQHRRDAVLDPLTGLLNRKALDSRMKELEQQARQSEASVCVIAADLDEFKHVNDTYGHARGDDVLRDVTNEMRKRLRTFELMYRVGGEEFLIVLPGVDLPEGVAVAERLRQAVAECHPAGLEQTISLGVAAACGAEVSHEVLLAAADHALYDAKNSGRNAVRADGHDDLAPMLEALGVVIA
jgi:diguanylate cyclase (GGDEF)-like protein